MKETKRERHRRKRAQQQQKERARLRNERVQGEGRLWRAFELAEKAEEQLAAGDAASAVHYAARAAALDPTDSAIGSLYLAAAEQVHDPVEQARALEHLIRSGGGDARLYARLAYLCVQAGEFERARRAVQKARATLPRRMKDRKPWLSLIEYVESRIAVHEAGATATRAHRKPAGVRTPPRKRPPRTRRPRDAAPTPVENRIEELYNLVSLIRPGHLGGRVAFLKKFSDAKVRRSEAARAEVRAVLGEVMVRNTRALSGVQLPPRFARTVLVAPATEEAELYDHLAVSARRLRV